MHEILVNDFAIFKILPNSHIPNSFILGITLELQTTDICLRFENADLVDRSKIN